ncbi:YxeA family protein [Companilactobacillus sp. DQM5]|uniref:YxeA family protein n=1 Tax=Companilactobacillus sp. DQM5 TaxID=3463359 RepID=UPI00405A3C19
MKRTIEIIIGIVLFFGIVVGFATIYCKDKSDDISMTINQANPFLKEQPVYVKIDNTKGADEDGYGNYVYTLTGYKKDGSAIKVKFVGMGKLKQDHYLKLSAKGTSTQTYNETFIKDMPSKVQDKFKSQEAAK